jgi:sphingomyelin phosphodiesterase acid-like 3
MASRYATCSGKPDPAPAAAQIAWLRAQLEDARRNHEQIWMMGHIPPGVDLHSTMTKIRNVCRGGLPEMFLSSEALAETLAEFGDVTRLAIFAHTHMDELRLLAPVKGGGSRPVVVKLVPSISPVDGNNPAFTVAQIDPASAILMDYQIFAASNQTGVDTNWTEEYDYAQAYREPSFSASSVADLIARFQSDPYARTHASQSYLRTYFVGDVSGAIKPFWPLYVCTLSNDSAASFRSCACPAAP